MGIEFAFDYYYVLYFGFVLLAKCRLSRLFAINCRIFLRKILVNPLPRLPSRRRIAGRGKREEEEEEETLPEKNGK